MLHLHEGVSLHPAEDSALPLKITGHPATMPPPGTISDSNGGTGHQPLRLFSLLQGLPQPLHQDRLGWERPYPADKEDLGCLIFMLLVFKSYSSPSIGLVGVGIVVTVGVPVVVIVVIDVAVGIPVGVVVGLSVHIVGGVVVVVSLVGGWAGGSTLGAFVAPVDAVGDEPSHDN